MVFFHLSALLYIIVPLFLIVLLLVWLLFFFIFLVFSVIQGGYKFCICGVVSKFIQESQSQFFFLVLGVVHRLLCAVILLMMFLCIFCVCCQIVFKVFLGQLCCTVGNHSSSLIYILYFTVFLRFSSLLPTFPVTSGYCFCFYSVNMLFTVQSFTGIGYLSCRI